MGEARASIWPRTLDWRPRALQWRIAVLFMVGSTCFALGSIPFYFTRMPDQIVGWTFFIGSLFFTSAAYSQLLQVVEQHAGRTSTGRLRLWGFLPRQRDWWATAVQFIGTLFFNANTFRAAFVDVTPDTVNKVVWAPDFYGSIAFLVASHLAWLVVCGKVWCVNRGDDDWTVAALNYVGSIFFMLSALGAFTLTTTGDVVNATLVNLGTFLGAVCFFLGAWLLLPARD